MRQRSHETPGPVAFRVLKAAVMVAVLGAGPTAPRAQSPSASAARGAERAPQAGGKSPAGAPLPDIPTLLAEVEKNQKALDALTEQYACRKVVEELDPTEGGRYRTKSVKEYEVFYLGGREVDRLVAKDGRALSPDEQQKENERVQKRVEEFERRQQKKAEREARGEKKDDQPGISAFLRVERFKNPRRVDYREQSVIAFEFEPNREYEPKTRLESLIHKLVGTAWVDDQAKEVVRLEARLGDSMKIGGLLLASIHKGSAFAFEQTLVNHEVWLPSFVEEHAQGRVLFKGIRQDIRIRYSDYKKFRVESVTGSGRTKRANP